MGIARASRQAATSATSLLEGARNIITAGIFHSKKGLIPDLTTARSASSSDTPSNMHSISYKSCHRVNARFAWEAKTIGHVLSPFLLQNTAFLPTASFATVKIFTLQIIVIA